MASGGPFFPTPTPVDQPAPHSGDEATAHMKNLAIRKPLLETKDDE
jgi:hypothetical protein